MSGEKRFKTTLYGYSKKGVNTYIEDLLCNFENNLKDKEEEIARLKKENKDINIKYNELFQKSEQIDKDRAQIADVLIKAEAKAQLVIEEAKTLAIEERNKIEEITEKEKERLVDIKEEIRILRKEIVATLKKYDTQLNTIIDE